MSLLDQLLGGYVYAQQNGTTAPTQKTLNFVGATVVDDPGNSRTNITITGGGGYTTVYDVDFTTLPAQVFAGASATIDGKVWTIYNGGGTFSGSITGAGMVVTGSVGGGSGIGIALNALGTCQANFRIWADMSYVSMTPGSQVFSSVCLNAGTLPGDLDGQSRNYVGYFQDPVSYVSYISNALVFPALGAGTAFLLDVALNQAGQAGYANTYIGTMSSGSFPSIGTSKNAQNRYVTGAGNNTGDNAVMFYNYVTGGTFVQTIRRLRVETL